MPVTPTPQDTITARIAAIEAHVAELSRAVGKAVSAVRDPPGNIVIAAATDGGGLGRPYIPITFVPFDATQWTGTTSGTATILATATYYKQHPFVVVPVWSMGTVAGTTGTVQLQIAGTVIGSPLALTDAVTLTPLGPFPVPGAHMAQVSVNVLVSRTGGTGVFRILVGNAYGMSP